MTVSDWSEEEKQFVLDFYNLSTLQPTVFEETKRLDGLQSFAGLSLADDVLNASDSLVAARTLLGRQENDPLGVSDENYRRELKVNPQALTLSSPSFDAKTFLAKVHADTAAADLLHGKANVQRELNEVDSIIKEMVRQNFTRFVNAKNSIDIVFQDMQEKHITNEDCLFGTKPAMDNLRATCDRAAQIFKPLLKRNEEEAELKKQLHFLNKYRHVFHVKLRLSEARLSGDFGPAVHEYKKGKQTVHDVRDLHEHDSLNKFWQGQVEPEAMQLKQHIRSLLIGPEASWGRSFDDHHRLILFLKVLDPKDDPIKSWLADYTQRLLGELERHFNATIHKLTIIKQSWRDDDDGDKEESVEGGLTRSLLAIIKSGTSLNEAMPRLDFECAALCTEQHQFFEGVAAVLEKVLKILSESGAAESVASEFARNLDCKLLSLTDSLLEFVKSSGVQSSVVSLFAAYKAISTLTLPLIQQKRPGKLRSAIEECILTMSRKLIINAWTIASVESKRIARWVDWDIDAADYSTAVMRSLERLLLHYFAATARVVHTLQRSFLGKIVASKNPVLGLERHVQACLASFLEEIKAIVMEHDQSNEPVSRDIFKLTSVATSYKLLLSLANLLYFRQISMSKIISSFAALSSTQFMQGDVERNLDALQHAITKAYLNEKQIKLNSLMQAGLFSHHHESQDLKKPRPFIFELLSLMAAIQTEISDVSKVLLRPLMGELITRIFTQILSTIRALNEPITSDMFKQLDAEIAILEDVLATGMSEEAEQLATACHNSLSVQVKDANDKKSVRFNSSLLLKQFASFQYT